MEILTDDKFIIPFLATLGASLTIILMQFIARYVKESKQKVYAVSYICDVSMRVLVSEFILRNHTILPHIEATERIVEGDEDLLAKTFVSDEFDILTASSPEFSHLPNEYSLQIGYDDIKLVQMYDTLLFLYKNENNRISLNAFVKANLKSMHDFLSKTEEKQKDILHTYHNYLTSLDHESKRTIYLIVNTIIPSMSSYINSCRFLLFSTKSIKKTLLEIERHVKSNSELIPEEGYMEKVIHGGIQGEL